MVVWNQFVLNFVGRLPLLLSKTRLVWRTDPPSTRGFETVLRLKRVELQGFKSFCDKTELRFNGSGIAAVVGPNGCGKSNLSDAISWVLGEQSARSLRGTRMEDVIFAGTRNRKPVGMASVTMTLVNPRIDPTITPDTPVEIKIVDAPEEVVAKQRDQRQWHQWPPYQRPSERPCQRAHEWSYQRPRHHVT